MTTTTTTTTPRIAIARYKGIAAFNVYYLGNLKLFCHPVGSCLRKTPFASTSDTTATIRTTREFAARALREARNAMRENA